MPSGKKLRTVKTEGSPAAAEADAVDDPPADDPQVEEPQVEEPAAVVTTPALEEAPAEPAKGGRRWKMLRRRTAEPETATTEEAPTAEQSADAPAPAEESTTTDSAAAEVAESTEGEASDAEPAEAEPVLVPHRPAGKRLKIAAACAAASFVAGGAFVGAMAQPVIANRALVETKLDIARTAANAITTLWSYTPENMDSLGERSARYLTGDLAFQYRKFIDSIVATNKQAQVTNTTSVLGTAVESVSQSEASAIVYTNSVATSPVSKNIPSLRYLSYRLEMKRDHSDWRITRMTTITTLDLTPQL
jgi:Mce-associated membrane protein